MEANILSFLFLSESIKETISNQKLTTFVDLFAGTGVVAEHFKHQGYSVIANDIQNYSYVINKCKLGNKSQLYFNNLAEIIPELSTLTTETKQQTVCDYLNELEGLPGFIYKNYSPGGTNGKRLYFTDENSQRCDAIRQKIEAWRKTKKINDDEFYFLLCSLIESIDKYANTASIYAAFLKKFKPTACRKFTLRPSNFHNGQTQLFADQTTNHNQTVEVYQEDANSLVKSIKADIFYIDPPYNHRQYSTNYHILETIALYDKPKIIGKTGLRDNYFKSNYCQKTKIKKTLIDLIENIKAKYIFLSYNNEGLLSFDDIKSALTRVGDYGFYKKTYSRYKADNQRLNKYSQTEEYLHYAKIY